MHALPAHPARARARLRPNEDQSRHSAEDALEVAETLDRKGIASERSREGSTRFLTTGKPGEFRALGERFLQLPIAGVEQVAIRDLELAAA